MSEIKRIPIEEQTYWKLKEIKARMRCKSWTAFFEELCNIIEEERLVEKLMRKRAEKKYTNILLS